MAKDWRDGWSSDADVVPGRRRRSPPVPGVLCLHSDSIARALDDFPSEGPPSAGPNLGPGRLLVRRPAEIAPPPAPVSADEDSDPVVSLEPLRETLAVLQVVAGAWIVGRTRWIGRRIRRIALRAWSVPWQVPTRREMGAAAGAAAVLSVVVIAWSWPWSATDVSREAGPAAPASPALLVTPQAAGVEVPRQVAAPAAATVRPAPASTGPAPAPAISVAGSGPRRSSPRGLTSQPSSTPASLPAPSSPARAAAGGGVAVRGATGTTPRPAPEARVAARSSGANGLAPRPAADTQAPATRQTLRPDASATGPAALAVVPEAADLLPASPPSVIDPGPRPMPTSPARVESPQPAAPASTGTPAVSLTDRQAIDALLGQYRAAFNRRDASAAKAVWPNVDAAALERVFGQVESQDLSFSQCTVSLTGITAVARCSGNLSYVPSVGSRSARTEYRLWDFNLRRIRGQWQIARVDTR